MGKGRERPMLNKYSIRGYCENGKLYSEILTRIFFFLFNISNYVKEKTPTAIFRISRQKSYNMVVYTNLFLQASSIYSVPCVSCFFAEVEKKNGTGYFFYFSSLFSYFLRSLRAFLPFTVLLLTDGVQTADV